MSSAWLSGQPVHGTLALSAQVLEHFGTRSAAWHPAVTLAVFPRSAHMTRGKSKLWEDLEIAKEALSGV